MAIITVIKVKYIYMAYYQGRCKVYVNNYHKKGNFYDNNNRDRG